jgi:hypothetical protein
LILQEFSQKCAMGKFAKKYGIGSDFVALLLIALAALVRLHRLHPGMAGIGSTSSTTRRPFTR